MKDRLRFSVFVLALLALLVLLSIGLSMHTASLSFRLQVESHGEGQKFKHELCLIYDKPKRTGSTTIARALHACWSKHHHFEPTKVSKNPNVATEQMLKLNQSIVAHSLHHIVFSDDDCKEIETQCRQVFHVTSTRRMNARILSYAKVTALKYKKGRNYTIGSDDLKYVLKSIITDGHIIERRYEKGVYEGVRRIPMHYVIRNDDLQDDLEVLLRTFACAPVIKRVNTHSLNSSYRSQQLESIGASFQLSIKDSGSSSGGSNNSSKGNSNRKYLEMSAVIPTVNQVDSMHEKDILYWLNNFPLLMGDRLHNHLLETASSVNINGLNIVAQMRPLFLKHRNEQASKHVK